MLKKIKRFRGNFTNIKGKSVNFKSSTGLTKLI